MKKLLAIVISMAMLVAMMPMGVFADGETSEGGTTPTDKNYVAQIGDQKYETLAKAVAAVTDDTQTKIELLDNVTDGDGIVVKSGKNIEFDFGGHTYTVTKNLAGSKGTESQCFQLLKDSTIKIHNGTIKANNNKVAMIIQNYSNLTLENVVLDGESITRNDVTVYTLSNNNGEIAIKSGALIKKASASGAFAMDVCWAAAYENGARVTINEGATIDGPLELGLWDETTYADGKSVLTVNGGTFNGPIKLDSNTSETPAQVSKNVTIKGGTFSDLSALDYLGDDANVTIQLKDSVTLEKPININKGNITLDLNGKSLSIDKEKNSAIHVDNMAKLTINDSVGNGKIESKKDYGIYALNGGKVIVNNGIIESKFAALTGNNTTGDMNFEVHGGTLTATDGPAIYMPGQVELTMTNGILNGGISLRMGQVNISGGTINAITSGIDEPKDYYHFSGNAWMPDALYVFGGTYTSKNSTYGNSLKLNITGGTFNCENDKGSAVAIYDFGKVSQPMNVSISGSAELNTKASVRNAYDVLSLKDIGVDNPKEGFNNNDYVGKVSTSIIGGMFSKDPSKYVTNGYTVTESNGKFVVSRISTGGGAVVPPATDNVTNNPADKNTTADLAPAVKDNKAETTVDAKTADKIVDKAVENKSTEVVIDAAGNNNVASSEVAIPEKTVKELAEKTDANLVIKTDNGKVDLDKTALEAVAAQAGTDGTVKLVVETVKTDENICHVDLKLVTSNGAVTDFKGGIVTVTITLSKELAAKDVVCVYINDNGIYTLVNGQKNADGTYTFTTGHFSEYAVMAKDEADKKIAEQLDTMIKDVNLKVRTSKTSKKNIKAVVSGDVKAITDAGYTVKYKFYRSEKKASKYEAKATKAGKTYINTAGKKGTKYYYKAKALVYDGDKLVGQTVLKQCKYGVRTWSK